MIFYFDWLYLIIMFPALILTVIASSAVNANYKKYSKIASQNNLTGEQVARMILDSNGLTYVQVLKGAGKLTDYYDPKNKVIKLSESTFDKANCAAVGIAAHEVGHAIQHAKGYAPLAIRNAIIPITNFGARLSMPLIILGILLSYLGNAYAIIAYVGIALFMLTVLFQLITLPVEFNASKLALQSIKELNVLDEQQQKYAKKVLNSAALTYVAALSVAISQLFYLLVIVSRGTRQD